MHGKVQASGLTEFLPFICTSAVWGQPVSFVTFFPAFPNSSTITVCGGRGNIHWITFQKLSFSFGGQKSIMAVSRLLIWQEIFSFCSLLKWLAEFNFWRLQACTPCILPGCYQGSFSASGCCLHFLANASSPFSIFKTNNGKSRFSQIPHLYGFSFCLISLLSPSLP